MAWTNGVRSALPYMRKAALPSLKDGVRLHRRCFGSALNRATDDDESDAFEHQSRRSSNLFNDPFLFPWTRGLGYGADRIFESPSVRGMARKPWDAVENEHALYLRIDMPGLGKEDVKVHAEDDSLVIRGEESETEKGVFYDDGDERRRYNSRIDLPPNMYKVDEIKAQMKNGVLHITVPKYKEGEGKNVFNVNVD